VRIVRYAGVDLAEDVARPDERRGTRSARGAANALQRLFELRVVRHLGAPVVHQDDVQLLGVPSVLGTGR